MNCSYDALHWHHKNLFGLCSNYNFNILYLRHKDFIGIQSYQSDRERICWKSQKDANVKVMPSSLLQSDGGAFIHMIMVGTFTRGRLSKYITVQNARIYRCYLLLLR